MACRKAWSIALALLLATISPQWRGAASLRVVKARETGGHTRSRLSSSSSSWSQHRHRQSEAEKLQLAEEPTTVAAAESVAKGSAPASWVPTSWPTRAVATRQSAVVTGGAPPEDAHAAASAEKVAPSSSPSQPSSSSSSLPPQEVQQEEVDAAAGAAAGRPQQEQGGLHYDASDGVQSGSLHTVSVPHAALPFTAMFVGSVILFLYGPRGSRIVVSVLVYILALSTMKLSVKWVFVTHAFCFAKFLSVLHFLTGGIVTAVHLARREGLVPVPTQTEFWGMIFPITLMVVASIGANNMALVFCSAAFTEIIGATACLITIVMVTLMGMPFDRVLILPVLVVVVGCMLSTVGELNFSLVGLLLCLISTISRSIKVALQQKLMTSGARGKFDPCALLFWMCVPSAVVMWLASLATEGFAPYQSLLSRNAYDLLWLLLAIAASCGNAMVLNMAQLFVTKDLGAVGSQLVAQAKMVLTVLGGMVVFGETMTRLEVVGFVLALFGVYSFSRLEQLGREKAANAARAAEKAVMVSWFSNNSSLARAV